MPTSRQIELSPRGGQFATDVGPFPPWYGRQAEGSPVPVGGLREKTTSSLSRQVASREKVLVVSSESSLMIPPRYSATVQPSSASAVRLQPPVSDRSSKPVTRVSGSGA